MRVPKKPKPDHAQAKPPRCLWCSRVIRSKLPSAKAVIVTVRLHRRNNQRKAYHQHLVIFHADCALQAAHELIAVPVIRASISRYDPLLRHLILKESRS